MNFKEMLQKRAALITEARALVDLAETEKRDMTAEEREQYDRIFAEARDLGDKIKREQALREEERVLESAKADSVKDSPEERKLKAFRSWLATGDLREYRALANDSDAAGGYLHAAEQFVAQLIKGLDNAVFVRKYATILPLITSDTLGAVVLKDDLSDPTWTTEIAAVDEDTTMDFGHRSLTPNQLSKLIKVSMKLLRTSALPVEALVSDRLGYKFAVAQENNFLNGTGSGQPMGVFTAATAGNGITTGRDIVGSNTTTTIKADSIIDTKFSLKAPYRVGARWLMHRDAVKMISKLKDGDGQYLWRTGLVVGEPDTLAGLPIDESEYAPNTFTAGEYVGILANWQYYWIAELQGVEIQRLNELYAANSQIGFIGRMYADAMPVLEEAFARVTLASV